MIDNDQITALAREYAEKKVDPRGFSKETYEDLVDENAESTEDVIRFLLRRYALVEKEKLRAIRWRKVYSADDLRSKFTEECLIDALFPEIAKEV